MKNRFEEKLEGIESYRWLSVDDCSDELGVSRRTIFQYLRDGKIKGTKWKNKRLVDSVSVMGFLLKKKVIEYDKIKDTEMKRELDMKEFTQS
ncbi:helix-turn-helix domain-containing protein [Pseudotenacibaculum sp. MALMAid0570]|uniref:helix-turn-helix domain-containing protein n=1 Tax=Pseudotenacibaculum sp. MALMAid0570 TaxID=3143938 RepID=UPI0032DFACD2